MPEGGVSRVGLVTEELSFGRGSGGIGGAFHELALALRRAGHVVDLIYLPAEPTTKVPDALIAYYCDRGIAVIDPEIDRCVWPPFTYERRSYGLFRYLVDLEVPYDFIHFHDYRGLGYFSQVAKTQCLGFSKTTIVVQLHGPTRWTLQANDYPFSHEDQLKIDFMERESIARADLLVSPSRYMVGWLKHNEWVMPPPERVRVIQNICTHLSDVVGGGRRHSDLVPCNELVFFGRHEERKGIALFCDALDLVGDRLADGQILITFLGGFGIVHGEASALYLAKRSLAWRFPIRLLPDSDRLSAARYLAGNERSVVVIPSRIENSPYTVLEAAIAGKSLITSATGGTSELLDPALTAALTCLMDRDALAAKLVEACQRGLPPARLALAPDQTEQRWIDMHAVPPVKAYAAGGKPKATAAPALHPKVVAAITHYERPAKLYDAVLSLAAQLYPRLEIVVVDDGSRDKASLELLDRMVPLLNKLDVRLLRQPNRYLGAARNHAVAATESDYVLFLDDDDIAFPNLVQTLVTAAEATGADIVNCLQLYMAESRRAEARPFPDHFQQKAAYVPTGGPLAMAPLDNCFGGSTVLIRRSAIALIGGYTEDYGVGHEDYEFYVRALQVGLRIEICPLPLVLYEVDRPSMITTTSRLRNWNRVVRAIDFSNQPRAWQDLTSVVAGRRAQEHVTNYGDYWMANDPQASLLRRIAHEPVNSADYATMLAEYAATLGATSYANALRALAVARSTVPRDSAPILMPALVADPIITASRQQTDALMLGALIDLSLDRIEAATDAFLLAWKREPGLLSKGQLRFLQALAVHDMVTPAGARQILGVLMRNSCDLEELQILIPIMFRLALHARDMQAAICIIDRATVVDEQTYLTLVPATQIGTPNGSYASALDHFVRVGAGDGNGGFRHLRELKAALRGQLGVVVPITSLRQYVLSLARGSVVVDDTSALHVVSAPPVEKVPGNGAHPPPAPRGIRPVVARN